ncbi:MAG: hypothetical protein LBU45_07430 [Azoarcus sp.]|jgi:predicted hotdog family 3-hydroxylacyl-ACP dehydratase|nr:hypothetical protein [Azoarcus sp.]
MKWERASEAGSHYLPIEAYVAHRGYMSLLDRVLEADAERILCALSLRADSAFCREGRVPGYVGIEYMAQAAGALIGWRAINMGKPVRIGFLVSVRKYISLVDGFDVGETFIIEAQESLCDEDSGLGGYACAIYRPAMDAPIMKAQLSAYMPKDMDAYLATI